LLHPGPDQRDGLTGPEQSEIPVDLQRPEGVDGSSCWTRRGQGHS